MSNPKKTAAMAARPARRDPLASLKMAHIVTSKPFLPAEILATIVDYLAAPDLIRFARVSKRMHEMVYDDARWIQRLKRMGCWNEVEARKRAEGARNEPSTPSTGSGFRRQSTADAFSVNGGKGRSLDNAGPTGGNGDQPAAQSAEFATARQKSLLLKTPIKARADPSDGFDVITLSSPGGTLSATPENQEAALSVLKRVRSIRGQARQEYGKVYKVLGPFYNDAIQSTSPTDCLIFRAFSSPEHQAQMLTQIKVFANSDFSPGSSIRESHLTEIVNVFDTAALLEFRKGYEYKDIQGRMRQYAHVIHILNGGKSSIELFLHDNRLITQKASLGNAADCVDYSLGYGQISLERTQLVFDRLAAAYSQEIAIIYQAFPTADEVAMLFLEKVGEDILSPFLTSLFDEAHARSVSTYLRTVSGSFAQTRQFIQGHSTSKGASEDMQSRKNAVLCKIFNPHLDLYLAEELDAFKQKADAEVERWDRTLSEQAASAETFLMSNVNRQADKKDFMSSFKKVVMMPVNILPSFSTSSIKSTAKPIVNGEAEQASNIPSRSATPGPGSNPFATGRSATPSLPVEAPTTELAAKAAVMTSKLDNIRSLFSIEVALNLVHAAKSSLERAAQFINLGDSAGEMAKQQCAAIFVLLIQAVGTRHVKAGFDKAIDHLSTYKPREANATTEADKSDTDGEEPRAGQVAPLTTFLELVNVGDLIQQMLDVFYESELVRLGISNRDDFLDPSLKEKKKFEAILDERVAAGLGKGIDVLMEEVEFICATTQGPWDFNPTNPDHADIGPTNTARRVVEVVGRHTTMLTGSTDKTLLDVFSAEVGLRLFTALCKHLKRQRISTAGAVPLLSDLSFYASYIATFKNTDLNSYFTALREVGQIYLIDGSLAGEMAAIIADSRRYRGVFTVEEVVEFAERRADWFSVKGKVEAKMFGQGCAVI